MIVFSWDNQTEIFFHFYMVTLLCSDIASTKLAHVILLLCHHGLSLSITLDQRTPSIVPHQPP